MALDPVEVGKRIYESLGNPIVECLEKKGITVDYLADKLKEELGATETKTFQYQGGVVDSDPKIAWDIRQRARMDAHKILSHYPSEKHHITVEGLPVVPLTEDEQLDLEARKQIIKERTMKAAIKKDV
jgi:hypothetical protein